MVFRLPRTATAPFCPSEVTGSVAIPAGLPLHRKLLRYAGRACWFPWAIWTRATGRRTSRRGSRFGYGLLFVVLLASLAAMLLQTLCVRLGLVAQKDLAQLCRERYSPAVNRFLWAGAELAIIACDLAEVLGGALALHLLFGVSNPGGHRHHGFRHGAGAGPAGRGLPARGSHRSGAGRHHRRLLRGGAVLLAAGVARVAMGFVPSLERLQQPGALYLAIGIVGATVMPHNLYLHSSIVQTRRWMAATPAGARPSASARWTR